jgi:triacylglycerol esterase/lipase EstA (alpha/beta hydrolase family)
MVPNITNGAMTIEQRAALLAYNLKELTEKHGLSRAHLVTHSFTGVDARAALSLFGASAHVRSLTTLSSPHLGMRLVDNCQRYPNRCSIEMAEKALEAVGLSQRNV